MGSKLQLQSKVCSLSHSLRCSHKLLKLYSALHSPLLLYLFQSHLKYCWESIKLIGGFTYYDKSHTYICITNTEEKRSNFVMLPPPTPTPNTFICFNSFCFLYEFYIISFLVYKLQLVSSLILNCFSYSWTCLSVCITRHHVARSSIPVGYVMMSRKQLTLWIVNWFPMLFVFCARQNKM